VKYKNKCKRLLLRQKDYEKLSDKRGRKRPGSIKKRR